MMPVVDHHRLPGGQCGLQVAGPPSIVLMRVGRGEGDAGQGCQHCPFGPVDDTEGDGVAGIEIEAQRFHWRSGELPMIACFPCRGGRAHQRHLNLPSGRFGHQRWYGGRR